MDKHDWAILAALETDGRQSYGAIAEEIGISKTPCWNRVQTMEKNEVITGYRAVLNPKMLGLSLNAFCTVTIEFGMHEAFERAVLSHPAVIECHTIAGNGDYLLHIITSDVERLDFILRDDLRRLPGVQRFSTTVCLKSVKQNAPLTQAAAMLYGRHRV